MNIYQPYTYLIGWTHHNKWYYGVRYAKNCHPSELWNTYYTSSKHVKSFRETFGEPNVIQIRHTFIDRDSAIRWETKVLEKMKVLLSESWLNKTTNKAIDYYSALRGSKKQKNHNMREKLRNYRTGKKHSESTKLKISNSRRGSKGYWKGKQLSIETRKKLSDFGKTLVGNKNPFYGKKHSEETKEKIRQTKKLNYLKKHKNLNN